MKSRVHWRKEPFQGSQWLRTKLHIHPGARKSAICTEKKRGNSSWKHCLLDVDPPTAFPTTMGTRKLIDQMAVRNGDGGKSKQIPIFGQQRVLWYITCLLQSPHALRSYRTTGLVFLQQWPHTLGYQ